MSYGESTGCQGRRELDEKDLNFVNTNLSSCWSQSKEKTSHLNQDTISSHNLVPVYYCYSPGRTQGRHHEPSPVKGGEEGVEGELKGEDTSLQQKGNHKRTVFSFYGKGRV